jgi:hypothetical protein
MLVLRISKTHKYTCIVLYWPTFVILHYKVGHADKHTYINVYKLVYLCLSYMLTCDPTGGFS